MIIGLYYFCNGLICFAHYAKTKESIYKQASIGSFLSFFGIVLVALKHILPIPLYLSWGVGLVAAFTGFYLIDRARRSQLNYEPPADSPKRPLILNIIIILSSIFLALTVFLAISLESRHDLLTKNGRTISGIVLDNDKQNSSNIIYYQFNDNGNLIKKSVSVKGVFQGETG